MAAVIHPGEVYFADTGPGGRRPVVVVSREPFNRGPHVWVVPFTSADFARRSGYPHNVPFRAGDFGLTVDCVAQCENLSQLEVLALELALGPLGVLDDVALRDVIRAVGEVMGADCEPQ